MSKVVKMKAPVEKYNGTERQTLRYLLKDVWFYYLNTSPRPGKGKSIDKKFPGKDCNYSVSILAEDGNKLFKEFTKSKKNPEGWDKVTTEAVDADDFEEKFGCKPPFEADTYYILKVSRAAAYKDGAVWTAKQSFPVMLIEEVNGKRVAVKQPMKKIKAQASDKHEDDKNYDVIHPDIAVGNGSFGSVILSTHFYTFENNVLTKPIQEQFIIDTLVPYTGGNGTNGEPELDEDELAMLGLDGVEDNGEITEEDATDHKPSNDSDDGDDEDLPDPDDEEDEDFDTED